MLFFRNDYGNGAHPAVMEALCKTNLELTAGYGTDAYCQRAADRIRQICDAPQAQVHFIVGGTQVNKTAIGAFLRSWEAVITADTGHIQGHEAGAVENNGHRLMLVPTADGKLQPEQIVVAAYGRILPEDILETPRLGSINVHSSILPKYRGAAPINWAILNGDAVTGVTMMDMANELDAGDIIRCAETAIDPDEDALTLTERLAVLGGETLVQAVADLEKGRYGPIPRNLQNMHYDCLLYTSPSPRDPKTSRMPSSA